LLWDWEGTMVNEIVRYFDLQSERRAVPPKRAAKGAAAEPTPKHAPVLPQYGAVALGVLADPLLRNYIENHTFAFDLSSIAGRTAFALLMAIVLLPAVYKNAFDPEKPILVQLCALFTSGVGWQSLFQAAAEAIK
jgi:hypothetical protein